MESIIKKEVSKILSVSEDNIVIDHRLMGGMSNYTYVVNVNDEQYTFRIPGKNAEVFVNRKIEKDNIELIEELNINNSTIYLDLEHGYKLAKYVDGSPLHQLCCNTYTKDVANLLKSVHNSGLRANNDYAPYDRLNAYENLVKEFKYNHDDKYFELKNEFLTYKPFLDKFETTLCHGDAQPSNIVVTIDKLYLVDWEFAGNNDPYYDIACYGNKEFELALKLLNEYIDGEPTKDDYMRVYLWRMFQCLQWHNVALYKEFIGLSTELKIDFKMIAGIYLNKAEQLLNELKSL